MKKLLKTILVLSLLVISACAVTACGVESITIAEDEMPQAIYVVGSDLNLENGKLTVKTKDGEKKVALSSSDVSVKGYDKDTLGEQTLTVSYEGKKTELKVKVVERVVVSGYVSDYFVGDEFDKSQGRMQITRDNGTQYSVFLKDDKVTIENFSSSVSATSLTATAKYTNGEISYSGTFPVNVYAIDNVALKKPTKTSYYSHETDLNLVGGKLTLKGNNGALVKEIALTKDMVSGFDLSKATDEHRVEPLSQTLTVSYLNHTSTFKVDITYTDVTAIKENAKTLAELDWTKETAPTLTPAQGELATNTMNMYFDLSTSLKALITEEERLAFARPAMVYGYGIYEADLVNYEKAFEVDETGEIVFTCESRNDTASVVALLADKTLPFYVKGEFLAEIAKTFSTFEVYKGVTFADFAVYDPVNFDAEVLPVLEFMVQAYDKLAPVADEWTSAELSSNATYQNAIEATYNFLKDSNYPYNVLDVVSAWREKDDYFDILYTYYYAKESNETYIATLSNFGFPKEIDDVFYFINATIEQMNFMFGYEYPLVLESSGFFYNYFKAVEKADAIKNGSDAMLKDLYSKLTLNGAMGAPETDPVYFDDMIDYLEMGEGGYQHLVAGGYGVVAYGNLVKHYADVMEKYFSDETAYKASADYDTDMQALLNNFVALTPTQQASFLTTIHFMYNPAYPEMSLPAMAFDYKSQREDFDGEAISFFIDFISNYYESKLTSTALKDAFADLMLAVEYYSQRYLAQDALANFNSKLESVKNAYDNTLTTTEKGLFDTYLGNIYTKYVTISAYHADGFAGTDLSAHEAFFADFDEAIMNAQLGATLASQSGAGYSLMFSAFERVFRMEAQILSSGDNALINAYYYEELCNIGDEENPVMVSYEYLVNSYRPYFVMGLTSFYGSLNIYDIYMGSEDFRNFVYDSYDITWTAIYRFVYNDDETELLKYQYDATAIYKAMNAFKGLEVTNQALFALMEGTDLPFYYSGISEFFELTLSANAATFANDVLLLETYYIGCATDADEEGIAQLEALLNKLSTAWTALSTDEQAELAEVKGIYDHYLPLCEELVNDFKTSQGA